MESTRRHVCFLRAINIGRTNRVSMSAFRSFFADLGIEECQSHIQSGNFILSGRAELMQEGFLEEQMHDRLAVNTVAFLRDEEKYRRLVADCPYAELAAPSPKQLLVTFFRRPIQIEEIASVQEQMEGMARLHLANTELYTYLVPEQQLGNFSNNALEKLLRTSATTRNWNTILKMSALLSSD